MEVFINQEIKTIDENVDLLTLLESLQLSSKKGIAIAVNNTVISKNNWKSHIIQERDKITIITATQGG